MRYIRGTGIQIVIVSYWQPELLFACSFSKFELFKNQNDLRHFTCFEIDWINSSALTFKHCNTPLYEDINDGCYTICILIEQIFPSDAKNMSSKVTSRGCCFQLCIPKVFFYKRRLQHEHSCKMIINSRLSNEQMCQRANKMYAYLFSKKKIFYIPWLISLRCYVHKHFSSFGQKKKNEKFFRK